MNSLRTRLSLERLDGRVMPDATPVEPAPAPGQTDTVPDTGHYVTATIDINAAAQVATVSGAASLPDLLFVSIEVGYIENGVAKTKSVTLTVDAEGSFTGSIDLPSGWTSVQVAGYYSDPNGGPVERVVATTSPSST